MPCAIGNFMNLWERRTNALHTECTALETVAWSTLKVSAIIIWKEPLAKNLSNINTLISGSIALLRKVELSKSSCSSWVICRIALLTYSIRYRLTWNYNSDHFLFWNEFKWADLYKESMKMLHSMNCTLVKRYYTCMYRYVDIFNLKKTRIVVPPMNIYIFDAINQVNCP